MSFLLVRPTNLQFEDWSDQVNFDLSSIDGVLPIVGAESEWEQWAENILTNPNIGKYNPPNPQFFNQWQEWAEHFVRSLE